MQKKLRIDKITLRDFKSFGHSDTTIHFGAGNNIIVGENGSGKSTILEAIKFGLFGALASGHQQGDVIRIGNRKAYVSIVFRVNNQRHQVDRTIKVKGASEAKLISTHENGEYEEVDGVTPVNESIADLLGISREVFEDVVFAEQGEVAALTSSRGKARKEALTRILRIENIERASGHTRRIATSFEGESKELETRIKDFGDPQLDLRGLREQLLQTREELEANRSILEKLRAENATVKAKIERGEELEQQIDELRRQADVLQGRLDGAEEERQRLGSVLGDLPPDKAAAKLQQVNENLAKLVEDVSATKTRVAGIEAALVKATAEQQRLDEKEKLLSRLHEDVKTKQDALSRYKLPADELPAYFEKRREQLDTERTSLLAGTAEKEKEILKIEQLENQLIDTRKRLVRDKQQLTRVMDDVQALVGDRSDLQTEKDIQRALKQALDEVSKSKEDLKQVTDQRVALGKQLAIAEDNARRIAADLESWGKLKSQAKCPTCKQDILPERYESIAASLTELKQKHDQSVKGLQDNVEAESAKEKEMASVLDDQIALKERLQQAHEKISGISPLFTSVEEMEKKTKGFEETLSDAAPEKVREELNQIVTRHKTVEQQLKDLRDDRVHLDELVKAQSALTPIMEELKHLREQVDFEEFEVLQHNKENENSSLKRLELEQTRKQREQSDLESLIKNLKLIESITKELTETEKRSKIPKTALKKLDLPTVRAEAETLQGKLGSIDERVSNAENKDVPELEQTINSTKKTLARLQELQLMRDELQLCIKETKIVQNYLQKLPEFVAARMTSDISKHATLMLRELISGGSLERVVLESNFDIWAARGGHKQLLHQLSGGERVAIAIALRLSMSRIFADLDFAVLDEPTEFLDAQRKRDLIQLLEQSRPIGQLLIVTHESAFKQSANTVVSLRKINEITQVIDLHEVV